ncbi:GDP-mannose 4,6-dehydratase (plasmid) [Bradyrhizobium barranii subsp. barranii]|uniref:UDP-glucose 4-epimerase n=1 Tax=Bradyrhizobium barranii subsp. barranii TaxID=2823807 RepID=A0A9X9YFP6_9BRAD|nr:NAD-dependent epimerase/dehydratase family protein [Bradyrhizobium barranii]UGX89751.1 GDP-mannose 4,6-dehydratase [Bradyrhizobium barranii subsp. barranii]
MSSQSTISPTATKRSLERVQSNLRAVAPLSARRHPGGSGGLRHTSLLRSDAVVHLAGLKAVGESNVQPITYYENNVLGTMQLVSTMTNAKVKALVFSSSATVYGISTYLPLGEEHPVEPTNPYGSQSLLIEEMLKDHVSVRRRMAHWHLCAPSIQLRARKRAR